MRIVFVQSGLQAGGAEKVVSILARHNVARGHEVVVIAFVGRPDQSYFPYPGGVRIITMDGDSSQSGGGPWRIIARAAWLVRQFRRLKPDIAVSFLTKTNVLALAAGFVTRVPVVISERNNPIRQTASPLWQRAINILGRRAAAIVMQTTAAQEVLVPALQRRGVVIPNPAVLPDRLTISPGDGNRIVAVGRLEPQKGFDLLLKAFAQVSRDLPKANLTIFGEGPERGKLQALSQELGVAEHVRFAGLTQKPGSWLTEGDIFVLSSRFEGFPNVLVEALSGGLASIAFDCPWGPADIIRNGDNGLLVPPEDVPALAQAMRRLLTEPVLRLKLARKGPATTEQFSSESVLAKWDLVIENAASGNEAMP